MRIYRFILYGLALSILASAVLPVFSLQASAISGSDFRVDRVIDDSIFFDSTTMTTGDIQAFLNSKVPTCDTNHAASGSNTPPFTCLKDYQQAVQGRPADQYCSGAVGAGTKSAAQIIKDISVACTVSPKVLIVLLQKEQSLVTDTWPWTTQYDHATGFACTDSAPCDPDFAGFFNQVWYAARQFQRYVKQPQNFTYAAGRTSFIAYQANNPGCNGTNVPLQDGSTAALYNYTPYQPNVAALNNLYGTGDGCSAYGNRNFWRLFNDWFGSTVNNRCNYNAPSAPSTNILFHKYSTKNTDSADFTIYSGTSTNCIESHVWNTGIQSWQAHIATVQPTVNYPDAQLLYGDLDGSGYDYPVLFGVRNTSTSKVESHVMNRDEKSYLAHAASNQSVIDPSDCKILLADLGGTHKDQALLVCERNTTSGMIEVHQWNPGMQSWAWHAVTNMPSVDPSQNTVVAGDINGDGKDELILVAYNHTGSGKIEFHVWNQGFYSWRDHIASNQAY